ncbi:MAG: AIR synthase family protein [Nitrososphaerota archaeon]|nr:AIR synthase family protein [Nitrososphaerota archaeon]MDG6990729.1 AIR synthase family protein [Nitrososphaerota archaeon]
MPSADDDPPRGKGLTKLGLGKIPIEVLGRAVLGRTGAPSANVVMGPKAGVDFAAIKLDGGFLLVSADPITGASRNIGRYAIQVSANDIATSGNRPQYAVSVVLLPEGSATADVDAIGRQIDDAARSLGVSVVGGHTEVTPRLERPIVTVTMFSYVRDFASAVGARDGDSLMMTKVAGLEGTAEIAAEHSDMLTGVPRSVIRRAMKLASKVSVVEEAVAAYKTGLVHAMHDCTEGGVVGGAYEMSLASGVGFVLDEASVPVATETRMVCDALGIDPLRLIGSGALLLAVEPGGEASVAKALSGICDVSKIGVFTKRTKLTVSKDGTRRRVTDAPEDELWRVLSRAG